MIEKLVGNEHRVVYKGKVCEIRSRFPFEVVSFSKVTVWFGLDTKGADVYALADVKDLTVATDEQYREFLMGAKQIEALWLSAALWKNIIRGNKTDVPFNFVFNGVLRSKEEFKNEFPMCEYCEKMRAFYAETVGTKLHYCSLCTLADDTTFSDKDTTMGSSCFAEQRLWCAALLDKDPESRLGWAKQTLLHIENSLRAVQEFNT